MYVIISKLKVPVRLCYVFRSAASNHCGLAHIWRKLVQAATPFILLYNYQPKPPALWINNNSMWFWLIFGAHHGTDLWPCLCEYILLAEIIENTSARGYLCARGMLHTPLDREILSIIFIKICKLDWAHACGTFFSTTVPIDFARSRIF
jgi:hypothetical protein